MDSFYYPRVAMGGWMLLVTAACMWLAGHGWDVGASFPWIAGSNKGSGPPEILPVVIALIAGVGGPPALGFACERLASFAVETLLRKWNMWAYPEVRRLPFGVGGKNPTEAQQEANAALFHICFYSGVNVEFLGWARRRRTHMYAALSSLVGILLGLFVGGAFLHLAKVRDWVGHCVVPEVSALVLMAVFYSIASREVRLHHEAVRVWIERFGARACQRLRAGAGPNELSRFE